MPKKGVRFFTALLVVSAFFCGSAAYADDITIEVLGETLVSDTPAVLKNGRLLVPLRAVFEKLGCDVSYAEEADGDYVYITCGESFVAHKIGSESLFVDGETVLIDVASEIFGDRTLVPLRAISEVLGCDVSWNESEKKAIIA